MTSNLTAEQQARRKRPMNPVIPEIAKAYQQDPRTALAQAAMAAGANSQPVAQGGYAWADGIARALQGTLGGYMARKQMQKYGDDEEQLVAERKARGIDALGLGLPPAASTGVLSAQAGPQAPQAALAPPVAPQALSAPPVALSAPPVALSAPPVASQIASALGTPAPMPQEVRKPMPPFTPSPAGNGRASDIFAITASTESGNRDFNKNGTYVTSPKGARGRMQVMPGTQRDPGFGVRAAKDDSPEELARVGREYLQAMRSRYGGDMAKAWAAYNAGPGNVDKAISAAQRTGRPWLNFVPAETRAYVSKNMEKLGGSVPAQAGAGSDVSVPQSVPQPPANYEAMPQAPAPVSRPIAPNAEPATKSRLLDGAYRMMAGGNRYESASAQDMYDRGLSEQSRFDETAAERAQRLKDMGYTTDLNVYANDASQRTSAGWDAVKGTREHNWMVGDREDQQAYGSQQLATQQKFQASQSALDREQQMVVANFNRNTQMQLQQSAQAFSKWQTEQEIAGRKELVGEQARARQQGFLGTPTGMKIFDDTSSMISNNTASISKLNQFENLLNTTKTGGFALGNAPGLFKWSSADLQTLESISNDLAKSAAGDMKGSLSDKDVMFVQSLMPSIRKAGRANKADIQRLRGILERSNDFQRSKLRAMSDGSGVDFLYKWGTYTQAVPAGGPSFDQWQASIPAYDASGKRTN